MKLDHDKIAKIVAGLDLPFTDRDKMTFGKHVGKKLEQVPASYLLWLGDQIGLNKTQPRLYAYIQKNRELLEDQVSEGDECVGMEDPHWGNHD